MQIQAGLGSDFAMPLDVCLNLPAEPPAIQEAMNRTFRWAQRSQKEFARIQKESLGTENTTRQEQNLFGIVQGGNIASLRRDSAAMMRELDFSGYAIGGLSVGESSAQMLEMVAVTQENLPKHKVRYLMGVGTPQEIVDCVRLGIDMFDCVLPTRNARNGKLFTESGSINIRNRRYAADQNPIDLHCTCFTCRHFTRSYLRHLAIAKEIGSSILNTMHNLHFYSQLLGRLRQGIREARGVRQ